MTEMIQALEKLSKLAAKGSLPEVESALKSAHEILKKLPSDTRLQALDQELSTWQSKISVIFKEPIGRQGMSKHCLFWVEKLKK